MKRDLTVIFLTLNKLPEKWRLFHREKLLEAIGDYPLITVSAKPMPDMPGLNIIQSEPPCASNVYKQMLRAAKLATTPFIAIAEDDSLYPREHFEHFRPPLDAFAYNMSRWGVMTWGEPKYFYRSRLSNLTLIAPRELLIKCLEERFAKYPDGTEEGSTGEVGKERIENRLDLPHYKHVRFHSKDPVINFNHIYSMDRLEQKKRKGSHKALIAYDVPKWRRVEDLQKKFQ